MLSQINFITGFLHTLLGTWLFKRGQGTCHVWCVCVCVSGVCVRVCALMRLQEEVPVFKLQKCPGQLPMQLLKTVPWRDAWLLLAGKTVPSSESFAFFLEGADVHQLVSRVSLLFSACGRGLWDGKLSSCPDSWPIWVTCDILVYLLIQIIVDFCWSSSSWGGIQGFLEGGKLLGKLEDRSVICRPSGLEVTGRDRWGVLLVCLVVERS